MQLNLHKFSGVGVALVTPFRKDLQIDYDALERLIQHTINSKVDYLVVMGTTGETATLKTQEKQQLIQWVIEKTVRKIPLVLGVGGNNTAQVVESLKNDVPDGISGILSVVPYYNKPTQKGMYAHYEAVANATDLPVILYNVPGRTGANMQAETTLQLAHDFRNIAAVKEASGNLDQIMQIVKNKPNDFAVISGDDAITLPLIALGVQGVISVTANALPKVFSEMVHAALTGNFENARQWHYKIIDLSNLFFCEGNPAGVKAALHALRISENILRLPLRPVSAALYQKIQEGLDQLEAEEK